MTLFVARNDFNIDVLKEFDKIRVKISGHTDDVGSPEYNLDLSKRRAASVKRYLVEKGIAEDRIETEGYGATQPLDESGTRAARAKNRRIEFERIKSKAPTPARTVETFPIWASTFLKTKIGS